MQTQLSGSAYQAQAILGAWNSGDAHRLHEELERVSGLQAVDSFEEERLELLSGIAAEMRTHESAPDDEVFGSLLKHLAYAGRGASGHGTIRASGYGRAAAAAARR